MWWLILTSDLNSSAWIELEQFPFVADEKLFFVFKCNLPMTGNMLYVILFVCYASLGISAFYYLSMSALKKESLFRTHTVLIQYLYTGKISVCPVG